jgi:hypothetical protein
MLTPETLAKSGSEHAHQVALFQWIALQSDPRLKLAFAIPNGGHRDKVTAARMKAEGAKAGVWDIFLPVFTGSCGLFIEMKVGNNKLTPKQEEFRDALCHAYAFKVCYSWEDAARAMQEYVGCK